MWPCFVNCKGINIREALMCSVAVSSRLQGVNEGSEGSQANSQVVTLQGMIGLKGEKMKLYSSS